MNKKLSKDIETTIYMYFDKKLKDADIPTELENDLWDRINNLVEDVTDMANDLDEHIDNEIEELEADYIESYDEELTRDMAFRERELQDISRNFNFTR